MDRWISGWWRCRQPADRHPRRCIGIPVPFRRATSHLRRQAVIVAVVFWRYGRFALPQGVSSPCHIGIGRIIAMTMQLHALQRLTEPLRQGTAEPVGWNRTLLGRLWAARWILVVAALALALIVAFDDVRAWHGLIAWIALAMTTVLLPGRGSEVGRSARDSTGESAVPPIETFLAAVQNPVVILDAAMAVQY